MNARRKAQPPSSAAEPCGATENSGDRRPQARPRSATVSSPKSLAAPARDEPVEIAIALVEHAGSYLIGLRPAGVALAGLWEFPGGKVQPGETARAAAARECREETGIDIDVTTERTTVLHRYDHAAVRLHFFDATPRDLDRPIAARFRWVPAAELGACQMPAANTAIVAQLVSQRR